MMIDYSYILSEIYKKTYDTETVIISDDLCDLCILNCPTKQDRLYVYNDFTLHTEPKYRTITVNCTPPTFIEDFDITVSLEDE